MVQPNLNPTRMERTRQKNREKTARRGHKLLKDKSDEMTRHFMQMIKQNKTLREQTEGELVNALRLFMSARIHMTAQEIENAVNSCAVPCVFTAKTQNIMGLVVPKITVTTPANPIIHDNFLTTHQSFDRAVSHLSNLMTKFVEMANVEKTCNMLAIEIEKTRRRVNALEYSVIPQITENIQYITMKLAENERSNQVRLMKVKELLQENNT